MGKKKSVDTFSGAVRPTLCRDVLQHMKAEYMWRDRTAFQREEVTQCCFHLSLSLSLSQSVGSLGLNTNKHTPCTHTCPRCGGAGKWGVTEFCLSLSLPPDCYFLLHRNSQRPLLLMAFATLPTFQLLRVSTTWQVVSCGLGKGEAISSVRLYSGIKWGLEVAIG